MISKKLALLGLAIISSVSMLGCDKYINGRKAKSEVIELGDQKFKCLKVLPENLKKFSVGESEPEEIRTSIDCINSALTYFQRRTDGSLAGGDYTTQDMRKFFSKYFLKENIVTPEFANELMKIKKALLGGSDKSMSKAEVLKLIELMQTVREEAVMISPHVKVLLKQDLKTHANWDEVSLATDQLRKSLQKILEVSQISKSDYSFEDAKKALAGFSEFVRGSEPFMPYERYSKWVPLVESVKNVLMGKNPHFVGAKDWGESLDSLIDLYSLALRYVYIIRDLQMDGPNEVRQMSQFAIQILDMIDSSYQMRNQGQISFDDIDNLIDQVLKMPSEKGSKEAAYKFKADSLKEAYQVFILKMLEPQRQGDSRGLTGLERKHIAAIRREINVWRLTQSFIDFLSQNDSTKRAQKATLEAYEKFDFEHVIDKGLSADPLERAALRDSWKDFGHLLGSAYPVNFSKAGGLYITYGPELTEMSWSSLTRFNVMKAIARFLTIGYGDVTSGELSKAKITKDKLISWYADFKKIGTDLKAFDPRTGNSGGRSFLEANFFTFSGDGDELMSDRETFEFVSLLFSAGMGTSNRIQATLKSESCNLKNTDVFGLPYAKETCFKTILKSHFSEIFANLPYMTFAVGDLTDEAFDQFYSVLMDSSRVSPADGGYVETADIRTLVTMLHYTETIMTIYDKNNSQGLSIDEIKTANPRFIPFFRTLNLTSYDTILDESFIFLVLNGDIPDGWDLMQLQGAKAMGWFKGLIGIHDAQEEAHRVNILRIMKTLKNQLNSQKAK
jgi:hypothetical protein